jgi:hypothetical protein
MAQVLHFSQDRERVRECLHREESKEKGEIEVR